MASHNNFQKYPLRTLQSYCTVQPAREVTKVRLIFGRSIPIRISFTLGDPRVRSIILVQNSGPYYNALVVSALRSNINLDKSSRTDFRPGINSRPPESWPRSRSFLAFPLPPCHTHLSIRNRPQSGELCQWMGWIGCTGWVYISHTLCY